MLLPDMLLVEQKVHNHRLSCHKHCSKSARRDNTFGLFIRETYSAILYDVPTIILGDVEVAFHTDMELESRIGSGNG